MSEIGMEASLSALSELTVDAAEREFGDCLPFNPPTRVFLALDTLPEQQRFAAMRRLVTAIAIFTWVPMATGSIRVSILKEIIMLRNDAGTEETWSEVFT